MIKRRGRGGRTCCTGEKFVQDNRYRVKPVQGPWIRTTRDPAIVITLAVIPESDLVEIMETDGTSDTVDKDCIGDGFWNDVGCVEFEEVCFAEDGFVGDISDHYQQEEDPG
jgi:hypothetical protein